MDFSLLIAPKQILQFYEDGRACVRAAVRACVCVRHFMIEMAAYLCQWVQNKWTFHIKPSHFFFFFFQFLLN